MDPQSGPSSGRAPLPGHSQARLSISVPSFTAFRAQASHIPLPSPVRRKPVPSSASPRTTSFSHLASLPLAYDTKEERRPVLLLNVPPQQSTGLVSVASPSSNTENAGRDLKQQSHNHILSTADDTLASDDAPLTTDEQLGIDVQGQDPSSTDRTSSTPAPLRYDNHVGTGPHDPDAQVTRLAPSPTRSIKRSRSPIATTLPQQATSMTPQAGGLPRSNTTESLNSAASTSPVKRKNWVFGWKTAPQTVDPDAPSTSDSDRSESPERSLGPVPPPKDDVAYSTRVNPPALDIDLANASSQPSRPESFDSTSSPYLPHHSSGNFLVDELERELREVSLELAGSIRREMELEDEIDRCKGEMPVPELTRRTSDYFSDSGASSSRYHVDPDAKLEELEKSKRKAEQGRGLIRAEYSQRLADELRRRQDLETHVQKLEQDLQDKQARASEGAEKDSRVKELEQNIEVSRRRLSQERQSKENVEFLVAALKEELEGHRNERDNLRDEVVPQLKSRIEGLEAEAAEAHTLRYENARMQQEMQMLKDDRHILFDSQSSTAHSRFNSIAEEGNVLQSPRFPKMGLSRSNSLARSPSTSALKRGSSLSRSLSVKDGAQAKQSEAVSGERFKDLEDQRDALHKTLKSLLQRHETQKREHVKAVRKLVADRDRARAISHGRTPFARDVSELKEDLGQLRRRADNALEQKWQYESNLGGVKMALDRAEQETRTLRSLLRTSDAPTIQRSSSGSLQRSSSSASSGLGISNHEGAEAETHSVIRVLRRSITLAENERDAALREAEAYRVRARSLQAEHIDREHELADQLLEAAARMEQLAAQVQQHLQSNIQLKERLAQAMDKGEEEQIESTTRVVDMQSRLKTMEERVLVAQQQSETTLGQAEEEAKEMEASNNSPTLQRLKLPLQARAPTSPLFAAKSPRIGQTTSGRAESLFEASKTATLQRRVKELESALADADSEMKGVVQRIESSQYEIAELQGERDEAKGAMRRLQTQISAEKQKAQALMR